MKLLDVIRLFLIRLFLIWLQQVQVSIFHLSEALPTLNTLPGHYGGGCGFITGATEY